MLTLTVRSVAEVQAARSGPTGCCNRHADNQACPCLLLADAAEQSLRAQPPRPSTSTVTGNRIVVGGRTHTLGDVVGDIVIRNNRIQVDGRDVPADDGGPSAVIAEVIITTGTPVRVTTDRSLTVQGPVDGPATSGGSLQCGNVNGSVAASGSVQCGNVQGDASAGGSIKCGTVSGNVRAGGSVRHG